MRKKALIVFTVAPKNSGLKRYKELAINQINPENVLEVRGEDVPYWVDLLIKKGKKAIGLTGEDLFLEYIEKNPGLIVLERIEWNDESALFRKPTLCLLGRKNKQLSQLDRNLRICISSKYKNLADRYLRKLELKGYKFDKFYMKGCVELTCTEGIADLVIDIVYSGKSMEKDGLKIFDKIMESDFVIIGGKNGI